MKHDNAIMYDVIMWNWNKFVIRDDVVFIASYINERGLMAKLGGARNYCPTYA
jgi:hypothetical protein